MRAAACLARRKKRGREGGREWEARLGDVVLDIYISSIYAHTRSSIYTHTGGREREARLGDVVLDEALLAVHVELPRRLQLQYYIYI